MISRSDWANMSDGRWPRIDVSVRGFSLGDLPKWRCPQTIHGCPQFLSALFLFKIISLQLVRAVRGIFAIYTLYAHPLS